jgi:hypothetical protein
MRTRTFALVVLVSVLGMTAAADPPKPEYKPFASSAGRYKVLFPGPVKTETTGVKTELGELKLTLDSVELPPDVTFLVTFIDYPASGARVEPARRLDRVRDGNKGPAGKLVSERDLTVGVEKHPGREVLIEKPKAFLRNRIVIAGSRLYQVMIQGPREFVTSPDADRFFDSFEVTR